MGEVFLARTPWPGRPLAAVKRLRPDVARVASFAERFRHEAELAVRLDHPNIVSTLDVGSVHDQLYVATELILGKDAGFISDRLRSRGQGGPLAVAVRLLLDGLAGLSYMHGARDDDGRPLGLVHRDVTPGNVLVGYDGRARLADFGLAKSHLSAQSRLTLQGEILGTPHYLPPEVVKGDTAMPAADIYGLGAVVYRFLTGVAPFQGGTSEVLIKVLSERPRPLSELRPDLPRWFVELVEQMLSPSPSGRPADARSAAERLLEVARTHQVLVPRDAVGRWLAQLFEAEHDAEQAEAEHVVAALDPGSPALAREGTVVLARSAAASSVDSGGDDEGAGTLLELDSRSLGSSPPVEPEAEEPTRAVEVRREERVGLEAEAVLDDNRTLDIETVRKSVLRSLLPGFAEEVDAPLGPFPDHTDTGLDRDDFRAVGPEFPDTTPESDRTVVPPRSGARVVASPGRPEEQLVTPVEDGSPQRPAPTRLRPRLELGVDGRLGVVPGDPGASGVSSFRSPTRSAFLLVGLLALAVAGGVGLGKVVAVLWGPELEAPLVRDRSALKDRLDALTRRCERLDASGDPDALSAWRDLAKASVAALEGDDERAARMADALERRLARP